MILRRLIPVLALSAQAAIAQVPVEGTDMPQNLPSGVDAIAKAVDALPKQSQAYSRELSGMVERFPSYVGDGSQYEQEIVIEGSDSMSVMLVQVGFAWEKIQPTCDVVMRQGLTDRGLPALRDGRCDLVAMARPLKPQELEALSAGRRAVHQIEVARDGVAIFVHCDNPLAGLTRRQCNAIFSATHSMSPGLVLRWNDIDPASPLGEAFFPLYFRDIRNGTMQRLMEWCMPGEPITTIGTYVESTPSSVVNACCAFRDAMGVSGTGAAQVRARMVPLANEDGGPFVAPSVATINDGSYPLTRSLNLVVVTDQDGTVPQHILTFLRFLWSQDGQDVVASSQLVPPDPARIPPALGSPVDGSWR